MKNILLKEIRLSASVLSFLFIAFGLMFFLPGYPVLCGAFFVTLGIFQSYQNMRETNDILYSALLPIAKSDVVKGKMYFACFIELCSFVLMASAAVIRMTLLSDVGAYRSNALMNANLFALGCALVIFGLFNIIFINGFFKTAYKIGKPFVTYIIVAFVCITAAESAHYFPGCGALNAFGFDHFTLQLICLLAGAVIYAVLTAAAVRLACRKFAEIDL